MTFARILAIRHYFSSSSWLGPKVRPRAQTPRGAIPKCGHVALVLDCCYVNICVIFHRIPPAERDMQRFFSISQPAAHEMVKTLELRGFITREPGKPRSIRVLLPRDELPDLE